MYLLVLLLPHEVQSNAGPHGQRSAVNVFVSVSCVFVSICKKKKKKKVSTQSLHCLLCILFGYHRSLKMYSARCIQKSVTRWWNRLKGSGQAHSDFKAQHHTSKTHTVEYDLIFIQQESVQRHPPVCRCSVHEQLELQVQQEHKEQ